MRTLVGRGQGQPPLALTLKRPPDYTDFAREALVLLKQGDLDFLDLSHGRNCSRSYCECAILPLQQAQRQLDEFVNKSLPPAQAWQELNTIGIFLNKSKERLLLSSHAAGCLSLGHSSVTVKACSCHVGRLLKRVRVVGALAEAARQPVA